MLTEYLFASKVFTTYLCMQIHSYSVLDAEVVWNYYTGKVGKLVRTLLGKVVRKLVIKVGQHVT